MPDVKISELPQAFAVGTADIFVLNQGGTTKTASKSLVIAGLATTDQIGGLNSAQVQSLTSAQIAAITPATIGALSTDAASGFATTGQISGFTNTAQVSAIASAQIAAITPASIGAVSTSAVIAISKGGTGATDAPSALSNLGGITSAALTGYATTAQVGGLSSAQVEALVTEQISALGTGLGAGQKWDVAKTYKAGDIVTLENSSQAYVSLTDNNTGAAPYLGAPWQALDANAVFLKGYGLSSSTPQNGQVLKFQSGYDIWTPGEISITSAQLPSNTLEAIGGAPIADPYFTGYGPQGPTKSFGTNNNYLATTQFVRQNSSLFKFSPVGQTQEISVGTKYISAPDLSFIPRQAVLLYGDSSNYMIGSISSYSGGLLVIDVTEAVGSGNFDVTITVSPASSGGAGDLLAANNLSDVANTATSLINLGGVSTARTISAGTGLTGGGDLTANRTLSIAALSPDPTGTYGSTSQIPSLTVNNLGQVTAASSLAIPSTLVNIYSTVGTSTWTKPAGAKTIQFDVLAGGGGGGAGGKAASGTAIYGGGGGGGAGWTSLIYSAADLTEASYTVTVGDGGAGGIFGGAASASGGISTVSGAVQGIIVRASAGGGGTSGTTANGAAGASGVHSGNTAGASSIAATAGGGSGANRGGSSGAAGGGCSTSAPFGGGIGGSNVPFGLSGGPAGALSTVANGGNGSSTAAKTGFASAILTGCGGGGGGATTFSTGSGGNGGNGSGYGCGGGGGGATTGSGNGGNGGNGTQGIVVITTYF